MAKLVPNTRALDNLDRSSEFWVMALASDPYGMFTNPYANVNST
jgi:hypothetical protein